jgi:hypothetical protein
MCIPTIASSAAPGSGPDEVGWRLSGFQTAKFHLHDAFASGNERPPGALNPRPGVALTGRIVQLLPSSDHAHATIIPMSSVPERNTASKADVLANCSDQ